MRQTDIYLKFRKRLEAVDAEIRHTGLQILKLQKAYTDLFPLNYGGRGWSLRVEKCYKERAKTCRSCPHNLFWQRYIYRPIKHPAGQKSKAGNQKKFKEFWIPESKSEKIPWDFMVEDKDGKVVNLGFKRRGPERREICKKIQSMRDRLMERRKKLLKARMRCENTLQGLTDSTEMVKETTKRQFTELSSLTRAYRRKRGLEDQDG